MDNSEFGLFVLAFYAIMTICLDQLSCNSAIYRTLKLQKCQIIYVYKYFTSLQLPTDSKDGKKLDGGNLFKVKVSLLSIVNALPLVKD